MTEIGLETPFSIIVDDKSDLEKIASEVTYPLILRPFIPLVVPVAVLFLTKMNFA